MSGSAPLRITHTRPWPARPFTWVFLTLVITLLDMVSGPAVQLPYLMIIPVGLAAWHGRLRWALGLSILPPLPRLLWLGLVVQPWSPTIIIVNAALRILTLATLAYFTHTAAQMTREVQRLRELLPMCSSCKRIRNQNGLWEPVEQYILEHSDTKVEQSVCPECASALFSRTTSDVDL